MRQSSTYSEGQDCQSMGCWALPLQTLPMRQSNTYCPPSSPKGRSGTIVFVSVTCSFIRSFICSFVLWFDTLWSPDSHSWTKSHRMLHFGTMIDPINTLLGIVCQLPWPIFDLVITYFLHNHLVNQLQNGSVNASCECLRWVWRSETLTNFWPTLRGQIGHWFLLT